MANNIQIPPPPVVNSAPKPHPLATHGAHVSVLAEKLAASLGGKSVTNAKMLADAVAKAPAEAAPEAVVEAPAVEEAPVDTAPADDTAADDSPAPAPVPAAKASVSDSNAAKLARSLEIQKRAEAAQRRAKAEASKIAETKRQAEKAAADAAELGRKVKEDQARIDALQREYTKKLQLAQDNPMEFARQHGVSGADIAEFVKGDADPNRRAIARLQQEFSQQLEAIREESRNSVKAIQQTYAAEKAAQLKSGFLDYVEKAATANPEQYQALDMVYSPDELFAKANELAEKNDRLQLGWNPDRLLEEIETEAKADPRWQKIQSRFTKTAKVDPKVPVKPNPKTETVPVEQVRLREPVARNTDGTFQGRKLTPMEAHKQHVARIAAGVRFG